MRGTPRRYLVRQHVISLIELINRHFTYPRNGCEVGVWEGKTSRVLLDTFPSLHLLMVDRYSVLSEEESSIAISPGGIRSMATYTQDEINGVMLSALDLTREHQNRRTMIVGDSIESSTFIRDEMLDFVFIDAHHSYESTLFDIQTWFPRVRDKGIVCGHDYGGMQDKGGLFGVKKAVDEFTSSRGYGVSLLPGRVWWFLK